MCTSGVVREEVGSGDPSLCACQSATRFSEEGIPQTAAVSWGMECHVICRVDVVKRVGDGFAELSSRMWAMTSTDGLEGGIAVLPIAVLEPDR